MKKLNSFLAALMLMMGTSAMATTTDSLTMRIKGMRCDDCANKVMDRLTKINGVEDIQFNLERRTATVYFDGSKTCADSIKAPLIGTRYNPTSYSPKDVIMRGFGYKVEDMFCQNCANRLTKCLKKVDGVDSIAPHIDKQYVFIRYDANKTCKDSIRNALLGVGFTPVNYYTSKQISWAYYLVPKEQAKKAELLNEVLAIDGVDDVVMNPLRGSMAVTYDNKTVKADDLLKQIQALGIKAKLPKPHVCEEKTQKKK